MSFRTPAAASALVVLLWAAPAFAQTGANVAVVINDADEGSREIGDYYVSRRGIPASNVIRIRTTTDETIERDAFVSTIERPIANAIARARLHDQLLYLVLTKGIPLRVAGTLGPTGTLASVDSELTLLYRRMTGERVSIAESIENPYFLDTRAPDAARRFTRRDHDIYLVTRLDGFTVADAKALVDRGMASGAQPPGPSGRIVLDQRATAEGRIGDGWMAEAAGRLKEGGETSQLVLDETQAAVSDVTDVLGYFSWGSTDPANRRRQSGLAFAPGAIAATLVGSDARTFREPPSDWSPDPASGKGLYGGTAESLVGDLIRQGVTGAAGNVAEAYFFGSVRPQMLFPAYLSGFNLAEAFYLSIPRLGWRTVVVGDPLATVATGLAIAAADLESAVDDITGLPRLFSARRLKVMAAATRGVPGDALALYLRADVQIALGQFAEARVSLDRALAAYPDYVDARVGLALLDEREGRPDAAMARYREILKDAPDQVIVLNNLAYQLVHAPDTRAEAMTLARRAVAMAPGNVNILDTLAWGYHLDGNTPEALQMIVRALKGEPTNGLIYLHGAVILASAGREQEAAAALRTALALDPALAETDSARDLQQKLQADATRGN